MDEETKKRIEEEEKIRAKAKAKAESDLKEDKKKEENKKVGKGCLVILGIIVFIIILINLGGGNDEKTTKDDTIKKEITTDAETIQLYEQAVLEILEENFSEIAKIELDSKEKAFFITATDPAFIIEAISAMEGDVTAINSWNNLVESFETLSKGIKETLPGYVLSLKNPVDETKIILMVVDGFVIYNFLD